MRWRASSCIARCCASLAFAASAALLCSTAFCCMPSSSVRNIRACCSFFATMALSEAISFLRWASRSFFVEKLLARPSLAYSWCNFASTRACSRANRSASATFWAHSGARSSNCVFTCFTCCSRSLSSRFAVSSASFRLSLSSSLCFSSTSARATCSMSFFWSSAAVDISAARSFKSAPKAFIFFSAAFTARLTSSSLLFAEVHASASAALFESIFSNSALALRSSLS
mmetsp:Transcript_6013/g.15279  ORF Transcript_6013/g.15279 Transcript_6013/m.15279 type:complete len:228 (+) Transcript_6013:2658-3341(+)